MGAVGRPVVKGRGRGGEKNDKKKKKGIHLYQLGLDISFFFLKKKKGKTEKGIYSSWWVHFPFTFGNKKVWL